jgi:YidC/Oxa1 family membrane protein insertase
LHKRFLLWLLLFFGFFLLLQEYQVPPEEQVFDVSPLQIVSVDSSYTLGQSPELHVSNTSSADISVEDVCPSEPFDVFVYEARDWVQLESELTDFDCGDTSALVFLAGETLAVSYGAWTSELFSELGTYKIEIPYSVADDDFVAFVEFEVGERGLISAFLYNSFYRPLYNLLMYFSWLMPGKSFGLGLVLLTILIRLVLLVPNHKALVSQRAMQKIQPELDAIKKKFPGDQQKIAQETMALWKRHRVSPLNSCLPMLLQFPILIALFYVVKEGIAPHNAYILYDYLHIDLGLIDVDFLGLLDLSVVNFTWLPITVGALQFLQMKLSFARHTKKKSPEESVLEVTEEGDSVVVKQVEKKQKKQGFDADPTKMMTKMMTYVMPFLIAIMTASLPAGVGLYWGISTLFGIGQQLVVNKQV